MVSIAIDRLTVALGSRRVVQDVSATLERGSLIGIIGPNGAGKSSLVRALLGLIPAAEGDVRVDGQSIGRLGREHVARTIAYLPQGQTLHWPLTVERLVALGRLPHLAPMSRMSPADVAAVERAIDRADVAHLRGRVATELSGGERARALLARTLAVDAPALIADEPLASLDPGHQIDVMALLRRLASEGMMVAVVLHDLTMAARYCDRLLLLDRGRLVADGAPDEVLTPSHLADVYGVEAMIVERDGARVVVPVARVPVKERGASC